jgi:hypothetical protein
MISILVLAMLLPFTILKDEDGNTLMSFSDFRLPDLSLSNFSIPDMPSISDGTQQVSLDEDLGGKDVFYKWYDTEGNVQFTSEPPPEGTEFTLKGFDPDANVIQSVKLPTVDPGEEESSATGNNPENPEEIVNPYSQDSIKKLFEDTRNIEKLLKQRLQDQDSVVNQ